MIKKILNVKDPILRKRSAPVKAIDKRVQAIIKDLKDTIVVQNDPEGVGLAAPQIGKNVRIFVMKPDKKITVVINPEILEIKSAPKDKYEAKNDKKIMEGCLSLPHYYGPLKRNYSVKIKYLNEEGKEIKKTFTGIEAQIIEHEIDHLEGVLFVDRLNQQKKPLYELVNGEWEKVDI